MYGIVWKRKTHIIIKSHKTDLDNFGSLWRGEKPSYSWTTAALPCTMSKKKKKGVTTLLMPCCGTMEQVHATEGMLSTLNFNEKEKTTVLCYLSLCHIESRIANSADPD